MLTQLKRGAIVSAGAAALLLAGSGQAWAGSDDGWSGLDCDRGPVAGCELLALYWPDRAYQLLHPPRAPGVDKPPARCSDE